MSILPLLFIFHIFFCDQTHKQSPFDVNSIWYPIPFMRRIPLRMARALGRATRRSKLVPPIYLFVAFFLVPICLLLISSCFQRGTVGFTVLGSFIVIICLLAAIRFAVWWRYQDGAAKCLAKLDARTEMTECKKTLPADMKALKKNAELTKKLTIKIDEICEHTGLPQGDWEMEEEETGPETLKKLGDDEEGTDDSEDVIKPQDNRQFSESGIMSA